MLQVVAGKNRGMPDRNPKSLLRKTREIAEAGVPQQITRQRTTFFSHKYSNKDDIAAKQCRIVVPLNYPMLQLIPPGNDIETGNSADSAGCATPTKRNKTCKAFL